MTFQVGRGGRLAGPLVPAGGQRVGHGEEAAVGTDLYDVHNERGRESQKLYEVTEVA